MNPGSIHPTIFYVISSIIFIIVIIIIVTIISVSIIIIAMTIFIQIPGAFILALLSSPRLGLSSCLLSGVITDWFALHCCSSCTLTDLHCISLFYNCNFLLWFALHQLLLHWFAQLLNFDLHWCCTLMHWCTVVYSTALHNCILTSYLTSSMLHWFALHCCCTLMHCAALLWAMMCYNWTLMYCDAVHCTIVFLPLISNHHCIDLHCCCTYFDAFCDEPLWTPNFI